MPRKKSLELNGRLPEDVPAHARLLPREPNDHVLDAITDALAGLRFGQVTIVVHDGDVVQIDRMERKRLT